MPSQDEGAAFMRDLQALIMRGADGRTQMNLNALRELVAAHGDVAVAAAKAYLSTTTTNRSHGQIALALGVVYEDAFGDDSLLRMVRRTLEAAGQGDVAFKLRPPDPVASKAKPPDEEKPALLLDIEHDILMRGDIFPLQRLFSATIPGRDAAARRVDARGRVVLGFPLENDSREVWEVPAARVYVGKLFAAMPYFPYYLHPDPKLGAGKVFFSCLADPDAQQGGGLALTHPSVVRSVLKALVSVIEHADQIGDTKEAASGQVLSLFPRDFAERILKLMAGGPLR